MDNSAGGAPVSATGPGKLAQPGRPPGRRKRHGVDRGASEGLNPRLLGDKIRLEVLTVLNRFRSIRTFDVVVGCFADRGFNAALKAAQRAMGRLKAAGYINRYRTDRNQHIYGLTALGAHYLRSRGVDARASVQGVSGMHNPIHQLWASFLVMCCRARELRAVTEDELRAELNAERRSRGLGKAPGLLRVTLPAKPKPEEAADGVETPRKPTFLIPDALANNGQNATWFEVDWSKRGGPREMALVALFKSVGKTLENGMVLRNVVVWARTEEIWKRSYDLACKQVPSSNEPEIELKGPPDEVFLKWRVSDEPRAHTFEVWKNVLQPETNGRRDAVARCCGHVIIQLLPTWLSKVRSDESNKHTPDGWTPENYLPYYRPKGEAPWPKATSPLPPPKPRRPKR